MRASSKIKSDSPPKCCPAHTQAYELITKQVQFQALFAELKIRLRRESIILIWKNISECGKIGRFDGARSYEYTYIVERRKLSELQRSAQREKTCSHHLFINW